MTRRAAWCLPSRWARRLASTARLSITWQAGALYAVVFGGYVAFSVYLPTYLTRVRPGPGGRGEPDGRFRAAGRGGAPGGGGVDRFAQARVLTVALAVVTAGAAGQAFTPSLAPAGTVAFLAMAAALGAGSGAVFALVAQQSPPTRVGR